MPLIGSNLLLWLGFAVLTGAVVWTLLSPLTGRRRSRAEAGSVVSADVALYRDQLAEVDRDRERGVIGGAEAEAARIEVSRRLLAANEAAGGAGPQASPSSARRVALAMALFVPLLSLGIYLDLGSPDVPDEPFAPRVAGPAQDLPLDALVIKVEQHLKEHPDDLRGWEVLAPAYLRQKKYAAAVTAWSRAIALGGESAMRLAARGEAEVFAGNGSLTPAARDDFNHAVKLNPQEPRAQYYLGLADIEDGHKDKAVARWTAMLAAAPKDAPWRASIERELAALTGTPGPTAAQVDAAGNMTPEARHQMIEGMVTGLATRLDKNPNDLVGWLRLIRAYGVLGEPAKANAALEKARKTFAEDASALTQLDAAAKTIPAQ